MQLAPFWRRRAHALIDEQAGRSDLRAHLHAYVEALALAARGDGTAALTRAAAAELLGLTERTVSNLRRWLDERGLLTTLEAGSTPATRQAAPDEGNRCAVYVLTRPLEAADDAVADEAAKHVETRCGSSSYTRTFTPPLAQARGIGRTAAAAAQLAEVCAAAGVSRGFANRALLAAGLAWLAPSERVHVLRHAPDGSRWAYGQGGMRNPHAAIGWQLRAWAQLVDALGAERVRSLLPDPEAAAARWQELVEARDRLRAEQAATRAQRAAEAATAAPMPPEVRARLEARRARRAAEQTEQTRQAVEARARRRAEVGELARLEHEAAVEAELRDTPRPWRVARTSSTRRWVTTSAAAG